MACPGVHLSCGRRRGRGARQKRAQSTERQHVAHKRFALSSRRPSGRSPLWPPSLRAAAVILGAAQTQVRGRLRPSAWTVPDEVARPESTRGRPWLCAPSPMRPSGS
eukprot:80039-Pyramimonas_sp.AAC.1